MQRLAKTKLSLAILDEHIAALCLALMMVIPVIEIVMRPLLGSGVDNAPVLVQHLGLVLAMFGALAAERHGHLTSFRSTESDKPQYSLWYYAQGFSALLCGVLAYASWQFVKSEMTSAHTLAYDVPMWYVQISMPLCFLCWGTD